MKSLLKTFCYCITRIFILTTIFLFLCHCDGHVPAPRLERPAVWLNEPIRDLDHKAKALVFLTNDCHACELFAPILNQFSATHHRKLDVIAIFTPNQARYGSMQAAKAYTSNRLHLNVPTILDKSTANFSNFDISVWPTLVLINKEGEITYRVYGVVNLEFLEKMLVLHLKRGHLFT